MFYKKKFHGEDPEHLQQTQNVSADQLLIKKNFDKVQNQEILDPISPLKTDYQQSPYKELHPGHKKQDYFDQKLD